VGLAGEVSAVFENYSESSNADSTCSEDFDAVGQVHIQSLFPGTKILSATDLIQWTPWLTATCVIIAAVVQHRDPILGSLMAHLSTMQGFRRTKPNSDGPLLQRHSFKAGSSATIKAIILGLMKPARLLITALDLQGFRYWLLESSLHDQSDYGPSDHTIFKTLRNSLLECDECHKWGPVTMYQCTNCDQRYCATCWKQKQRLGAKLRGYDLRIRSSSRRYRHPGQDFSPRLVCFRALAPT